MRRWRVVRGHSLLGSLAMLIVGLSVTHGLRAFFTLDAASHALKPAIADPVQPAATATTMAAAVAEAPLVVAYCTFPDNRTHLYPPLHAQWLAEFIAPHLKPSRRLILRSVLSHIKLLPHGVNATSAQGLERLGLANAHLRICPVASKEMIRTLASLPHMELRSIDTKPFAQRLAQPPVDGWSHDHRVHWPAKVTLVVDVRTGKPAGPLFTRQSHEGWQEQAAGALLQFDTKLELLSPVSLSAYLPFAVDSFSWRYSPTGAKLDNRFAKLLDSGFTDLRHVVTRPTGFNATRERLGKEFFMAMVNSNCGGTGMPAVRQLFGYAVFEIAGKPVNNLGRCPGNPEGAVKAGLSVEQRAALRSRFRRDTAIEIFRTHKFALVFENTLTLGYVTEKIVNAYAGRAVPVFWGGALNKADLTNVLNPRAYVHCAVPVASDEERALRRKLCAPGLSWRDAQSDEACVAAVNGAMADKLRPHFAVCVRELMRIDGDDAAYDAMLAEPLVPTDASGALRGVWDGAPLGKAVGDLLGAFSCRRRAAAGELTARMWARTDAFGYLDAAYS